MKNLKIGDKVYFTKESAPKFELNESNHITINKEYTVIGCNEISFRIINNFNRENFCLKKVCAHLYGGNWIKSKNNKQNEN